MTHPRRSDPFIAQEIERALEPYAAALGPAELDWAREQLAEMLETDEQARQLLDAAYPRQVEQSGEQLRPSAKLADATRRADDPSDRRADGTGR